MALLGRGSRRATTVYLTGGATAVLHGFRDATIDIDIKVEPDPEDLLRRIPQIKEALEVNVELASPDLFIPVSEGWESRSPLVETVGSVTFRHFDPVAQALAKIERGHERDISDVHDLIAAGLATPASIRAELDRIEPDLYRFPAIDPPSLRAAVDEMLSPYEL